MSILTRRNLRLGLAAGAISLLTMGSAPQAAPTSRPAPPSEGELQAARYGLDYDACLKQAIRSDAALRQFFLISFMVDAAGAETYSGDIDNLEKRIGEKRFLRVMLSVPEFVQKSALDEIAYDAGWGNSDKDWADFCRKYPHTAQRMAELNIAEVASTGKPRVFHLPAPKKSEIREMESAEADGHQPWRLAPLDVAQVELSAFLQKHYPARPAPSDSKDPDEDPDWSSVPHGDTCVATWHSAGYTYTVRLAKSSQREFAYWYATEITADDDGGPKVAAASSR